MLQNYHFSYVVIVLLFVVIVIIMLKGRSFQRGVYVRSANKIQMFHFRAGALSRTGQQLQRQSNCLVCAFIADDKSRSARVVPPPL